MKLNFKIAISILLVLNIVVLMGQLMPEATPPFAVTVNIIFLVLNLILILSLLFRKKTS